MSTAPEKTKPAPITIDLKITLPAQEEPSLADVAKVQSQAEKIKTSIADVAGATVEGSVTIGKQKFKL